MTGTPDAAQDVRAYLEAARKLAVVLSGNPEVNPLCDPVIAIAGLIQREVLASEHASEVTP